MREKERVTDSEENGERAGGSEEVNVNEAAAAAARRGQSRVEERKELLVGGKKVIGEKIKSVGGAFSHRSRGFFSARVHGRIGWD